LSRHKHYQAALMECTCLCISLLPVNVLTHQQCKTHWQTDRTVIANAAFFAAVAGYAKIMSLNHNRELPQFARNHVSCLGLSYNVKQGAVIAFYTNADEIGHSTQHSNSCCITD